MSTLGESTGEAQAPHDVPYAFPWANIDAKLQQMVAAAMSTALAGLQFAPREVAPANVPQEALPQVAVDETQEPAAQQTRASTQVPVCASQTSGM